MVEQLIASWYTILGAAAGIMLTVSLMSLGMIFTSDVFILQKWQLTLIGFFIIISSIFLLTSLILILRAHGTLIMISSYDKSVANGITPKSITRENLEESMRKEALQARKMFEVGAIFVFVAILATVILANVK